MQRHVNDFYVKKSRYQNYRSRAAFKLIEIDDKYKLLKPGMIVIECGSAPGSWTQVLVERLQLKPPNSNKKGAVIALDLVSFAPVEGAICLPKTDFMSQASQAKILNALDDRKADLILSDMCPNITGQHDYDHECIMKLVYSALRFSTICLKDNGSFLVKILNGKSTEQFVSDLKNYFSLVKIVKPDASRMDSTEQYILGKGFQSKKM